jgi:hypothetical protein
MSAEHCRYEDELLDSLARGYVAPDLDAHVAACNNCSELRVVAGALLDDRHDAMSDAAVPSSAMMWRRIQMRDLQVAQSRARRSLLIGQAATLCVALGLMMTFFGSDVFTGVTEMVLAIRLSTPWLLAIASALVLAPIGGYVAITQK